MRSQGASNGDARRGGRKRPRGRTLRVSAEERELLRRACAYYRSSVPSYLASRQEEVRLLERLLRQLD